MKPVIVYGANGRMGSAVASALVRSRWPVVAAGRNREKVSPLARALDVEARIGPVEEARALFSGAGVVVNCAGPFLRTARPIASACIALNTDYLDLDAERVAMQAVFDLHDAARRSNVTVVSSAGAAGALGGWARALADEIAATPLQTIDLSYAHGSASFMRPTAGALQSFANEVLQMLLPENGGYWQVPRRVQFPPPFGLGHAIQTRGPDDLAFPDDTSAGVVRTWVSVDPGSALNAIWTIFHEPSLARNASGILTALWRAAATADPSTLARIIPSGEDAPFAVVVESNGPRVAVAAEKARAATAQIVELCLRALGRTAPSGVVSPAMLVPARTALRTLSRAGAIRVFRDGRNR